MTPILQASIPEDMRDPRPLPGIAPLSDGRWLRVDEAYAGQMAHRRRLISGRRGEVLWQSLEAGEACAEVMDEALKLLPSMGFDVSRSRVVCPDGHEVDLAGDTPLALLGQIVQEDICVLQKVGAEHVLTGANLCFPAYWMLSEKAGRPLVHIHGTVPDYDDNIARRVQRLFDGVQVGRPIWRHNRIWRDDPELFQPWSVTTPRGLAPRPEVARYVRAERQSILRLPQSGAVVFSIHTYIAATGNYRSP
jgi:hypothetical protein